MAKLKLQAGDGPTHTLEIPWDERAVNRATIWEALEEVGEPATRRETVAEFFEDDGGDGTGGDDG